ncbi:MAG: hypothetical protein IPQ09_28620 [Myxococcales bacterium]|nr:hypothetical protein [Myxococcales bacterium]
MSEGEGNNPAATPGTTARSSDFPRQSATAHMTTSAADSASATVGRALSATASAPNNANGAVHTSARLARAPS